MKQLIDDFMLTVEASGDVESDDTVQWYKRRMRLFTSFVREKEIADPLTKNAFRRYAIHLKRRDRLDGRPGKLSVYYRRGCLKAVKRFGTWLHDEGLVEHDLGKTISLPRIPKAPPRAVTPDDLEKMIAACNTLRDRALLCTMRDTGCRAGEMIDMTWQDVHLQARRIFVTGKRQKSRWVFVSRETSGILAGYKKTVPHDPDDPVWWGYIGRKDSKPLRYRGLHSLLKRIAERANVTGRWNPHAWRHAFGKRMNKAGVPTLALQGMMGHESPETTAIYAGLEPDELQDVYDAFAPHPDND